MLAGIQLAGLLFFLNPHWPFEFMPLVRAVALYSVLLAIGSLLLLLPFTWRQPARARRVLPWALFVVFSAAGACLWVHASRFSLYLPSGINRRLIKAALWLSLAGVIVFYTALLHSMHRRRYGRRSRIGIALLAVLVSYVVFERRDAFRPEPSPAPRPSTISASVHPNLLVVGIEGLTLDVVLPLAEQGELPFLAQIRRQGSSGRMVGVSPSVRVPSWTTLATGKFPFRHGVVGDRRYSADFVERGLEFRLIPVGLGFRRWGIPGGDLPGGAPPPDGALPLWNILAGLGLPTAVFDWPGALPSADLDTLTVASDAPPVTLEAEVELPSALEAAPIEDRLAYAADLATAERARTWLSRCQPLVRVEGAEPTEQRTCAAFLSLGGALQVGRETFGAYSDLQFEGLTGPDREARSNRLVAYYKALDALLRDLWLELPSPRLMVIASPYGLRTRQGLEQFSGLIRRQRSFEGKTSHAPDGAFLAYGAWVEPGRFLTRIEITDLAPTVLHGSGFPTARDLDGRVRTEVFRQDWLSLNPIAYVPSYETVSVVP